MDVHDCATVSRGRDVPAGAVFTIEPGMCAHTPHGLSTSCTGLYIRADDTAVPAHFRGIGIRIEDDVL
jgi:Xaa-Pro aminopeptidase